ncbi:MAG TPA: hypothetical protein VM307_16185 [Egibacteraceae bacterium]|nr:hypothetical protein [Egibacteraceae bacterium]
MLTRKRTNPLFHPDAFRLIAGEERAERALNDPDSLDLLVWNVFASLETHEDQRWLAGRMQLLGGPAVREPVRMSLWAGGAREPRLEPPGSYLARVRERARQTGADDASVASFGAPVTVPVLIESPDVVILVDAVLDRTTLGHGGRERIVELIDVGLEHARRLDKQLAVATIYRSGSPAAAELSARINALRTDKGLAEALDHRRTLPAVVLREISWQQLLRIWQTEAGYLRVPGHQVKAFVAHCRERGLL